MAQQDTGTATRSGGQGRARLWVRSSRLRSKWMPRRFASQNATSLRRRDKHTLSRQMTANVEGDIANQGELVSLFCGAGGLDLGFELAGFGIAAAIDLREFSIESHNHNRTAKCGHVGDVNTLDAAGIDRLAGRALSPVGLIGGPPCQSFSRAAHSADNDHRHELPLEFARILAEFNERGPVGFFVFENVPGLLKQKHRQRYEGIVNAFCAAGFAVEGKLLNASAFGVAQNRPRLIIVGFNKALYPGLKWDPPEVRTAKPKPVKDVIKGLPAPVYWTRDLDRASIGPHPNHWCMTPKSKKFSTPGALVLGTSRGRSFRMLAWDEPSPTVAYGNREVHVHPDGLRRLSVYEALLLQGFPSSYELLGSLSDQITQVSEAVPPPLGEAIAQSIKQALVRYAAEAVKAG
jgi:DNA (cytosine-5)-methyltransferase 1